MRAASNSAELTQLIVTVATVVVNLWSVSSWSIVTREFQTV